MAPRHPGSSDPDRFLADLRADERLAATARVDWLRRQADEDDTWRAVVASLGERGATVAVELAGGRRIVGAVRLAGADVVGLVTEAGTQVLVATAAVAALRALEVDAEPTGDRTVATGQTLVAQLRLLAEIGAGATIRAGGGDGVHGDVVRCGADLVMVRPPGGGPVLIPLANVTDVVVEDRIL